MERIHAYKEHMISYLLGITFYQRNTFRLYSIWLVVLILFYYEFFFKVICIAKSYNINFLVTCTINISTYICVGKIQTLFAIFSFAHTVIFAVKLVLPKIENDVSEFETVFDIVEQCESTYLFGIILTYSTVYFQEVHRNSSKFIPIQLNDITVGSATYPTLGKTCSCLKQKYNCILNAMHSTEKPHILLFRTKETSNKYDNGPFTSKEIESNEPFLYNSNWYNRNVGRVLVDTYSQKNVPFIIVMLISVDETGNIKKQDKHLLRHCHKDVFPHNEKDVLYLINKPAFVDLKEISKHIQYKLKLKGDVNSFFRRTFEYADDNGDLKKRIGRHLDRKLYASIVCNTESFAKQTYLDDFGLCDSPTMYSKHESYSNTGSWNEILHQFKQSFPDNCAMLELQRKSSKFIPIQLKDITVGTATYPRLRKTSTWLKTKYDSILGSKHLSENAHVLLFRMTETSNESDTYPFPSTEIENSESVLYNWYNRHVGRLLVDKYSQKNVLFIIVLLIGVDENGNIKKQDKHLLRHFHKDVFPKHESDVLYVVYKPDYADLKELSKDIQHELKIKGDVNKVFRHTFDYTNDTADLKKRIGLHLERKLHASIVYEAERVQKQTYGYDLECHDSPTMYNPQSFSESGPLNEIFAQFKQSFPDNCAMHELQILMKRNKEVKAYGFDENKIMVFVEQEEQKSSVKAYLYKYFPECEETVTFKLWGNKTEISKCHLKQGSKVLRSDLKHGTLGMFLRDQKGNIYFTTCSHVTEKDQDALCKDKAIIGKSVFSIDTATDTNVSELLDLSIIKVEDALKLKCHLGLRNVHDNQVTGQIVEEEDIHHEIHNELKIYKWGATTNLTTGTYKGWIASKDCSDRFDKSLHRIVGEANKVFSEGDSGSLVCFKATGSPHLDVDSAVFIFVGKLISSTECAPVSSSPEEWYYCFHVSKIFDQKIENVEHFEPCLKPECRNSEGCLKSGQMLQS